MINFTRYLELLNEADAPIGKTNINAVVDAASDFADRINTIAPNALQSAATEVIKNIKRAELSLATNPVLYDFSYAKRQQLLDVFLPGLREALNAVGRLPQDQLDTAVQQVKDMSAQASALLQGEEPNV